MPPRRGRAHPDERDHSDDDDDTGAHTPVPAPAPAAATPLPVTVPATVAEGQPTVVIPMPNHPGANAALEELTLYNARMEAWTLNQNATFQLRNMELLNKLVAKLDSKNDSKDTSINNPSLEKEIPPWPDPKIIDIKTAEGRTKWVEDCSLFYSGIIPPELVKAANLTDPTPAVFTDPKIKALLKDTANYPRTIDEVHKWLMRFRDSFSTSLARELLKHPSYQSWLMNCENPYLPGTFDQDLYDKVFQRYSALKSLGFDSGCLINIINSDGIPLSLKRDPTARVGLVADNITEPIVNQIDSGPYFIFLPHFELTDENNYPLFIRIGPYMQNFIQLMIYELGATGNYRPNTSKVPLSAFYQKTLGISLDGFNEWSQELVDVLQTELIKMFQTFDTAKAQQINKMMNIINNQIHHNKAYVLLQFTLQKQCNSLSISTNELLRWINRWTLCHWPDDCELNAIIALINANNLLKTLCKSQAHTETDEKLFNRILQNFIEYITTENYTRFKAGGTKTPGAGTGDPAGRIAPAFLSPSATAPRLLARTQWSLKYRFPDFINGRLICFYTMRIYISF